MSQSRELSADQKAQLKQQAQQFETQLASNSQDVEALEGAGVSYAQLGDFKRAEALLTKLTSAKPKDPEALRLLVGLYPRSWRGVCSHICAGHMFNNHYLSKTECCSKCNESLHVRQHMLSEVL